MQQYRSIVIFEQIQLTYNIQYVLIPVMKVCLVTARLKKVQNDTNIDLSTRLIPSIGFVLLQTLQDESNKCNLFL